MGQFDFVCDDHDDFSLRLLQRNPADCPLVMNGLRVHILCSDCVAGIDIEAESWAGFVDLFQYDYVDQRSRAWLTPAGDWKLMIEHLENDDFLFTSQIDSLKDVHRWKLQTTFQMSADRFRQVASGVLEFIGTCH